jgi:hypothetical protein
MMVVINCYDDAMWESHSRLHVGAGQGSRFTLCFLSAAVECPSMIFFRSIALGSDAVLGARNALRVDREKTR